MELNGAILGIAKILDDVSGHNQQILFSYLK